MPDPENKIEDENEKVLRSGFLAHYMTWTIAGGFIVALLTLGTFVLVGQVYNQVEARRLIEAATSTIQTLCFAGISAASTILTLMLTMLGLIKQSTVSFSVAFYERIEQIALLCTFALINGVLLLAIMTMPLEEAENVPNEWFGLIYYVFIFSTAVLSGLLVAIILVLFDTAKSIIQVLKNEALKS
jgi:hypothetical protein